MKESMKRPLRLFNRFTFGYFTKLHFRLVGQYVSYVKDLRRYRHASGEKILTQDLQPVLGEDTATTHVDYDYFYQDTWCARHVFEAKPKQHVDVGSTVLLVGILSQFTHTVNVDVRPLDVALAGLEAKKGNSCDMPFEDASVESLSSICVIEHIGLGRYGDPLDPEGTEKTIKEFQRVVKPGGNIYVSVPVGTEEKVRFNAHRVFVPEQFVARFDQCVLKEMKFVCGKRGVFDAAQRDALDWNKEMIGLFHFAKR